MASPQTENFFPRFPPPPSHAAVPPPSHLVPPSPATKSPPPHIMPPPSPTTRPPPPHTIPPPSPTTRPPPPHIIPPPSPATRPPPPHSVPAPPPHAIPPPHVTPPPPHMLPPPPPHTIPPPPPPSPGNHTTIIVVVFVSCGGVFFLAFVMAALWCFLKKKRKNVQKTENFHIDEHRTVKESIVQGPHGAETVVLSVEDDIHIEEDIRKSELENFRKGLHLNPGENAIAGSMEAGEPSSSGSNPHHYGHQTQ